MSLTAMPTITAVATAATTSTWATPTITPPSALENPYVWRSSAPTGTVFIAVGSIAAFFVLCLIVFLIIRSILARRAAQKSLSLSDSPGTPFHQGGHTEKQPHNQNNLRKSFSQGKISLLYETKADDSMTDVSEAYFRANEAPFSTLDVPDNKRRTMFISPTAEVMNLTKNHQRVVSSVSNFGSQVDVSSGPGAYRQNHHERNESYDNYTDVSIQSPERGASRQYKARSRAVPSAYLESMFEDS